jgi:hypothetical protein
MWKASKNELTPILRSAGSEVDLDIRTTKVSRRGRPFRLRVTGRLAGAVPIDCNGGVGLSNYFRRRHLAPE